MKHPYLMSRVEWQEETEKCKSQGSGLSRVTKASASQHIAKITKLTELFYGVHEWLYKKALAGDEEALYLIEWGYDAHDRILLKAKEEGKIDLPVQWIIDELEASAERKVLNTYRVKWYEWGFHDEVRILTEDEQLVMLWKDCIRIEKIAEPTVIEL